MGVPFVALGVALAIVGCGASSVGGATRYDIHAGKLCLSLASQLKSVVSRTTFALVVPGVSAHASFAARQRERFIHGAIQTANVVDSVLAELAAVSAPTSRTSAKRRFEAELRQGATAFRAFAKRFEARPPSDSESASYIHGYVAGTLDTSHGCTARVRTYERDELARYPG